MIGYEKYKLTHSLGFEKIPVEWDLKKVKYLFHIGRGRVISQEELMDNGLYPVFSSQTQNNGCLGYINTFDFDCDQLTWTTDGANAGTVFIRSGKHNCTNVCGTLQPITYQTNLKFSHYALQYATQFHKRPDTNGAKIMNNEMAEISFALPAECEQFKIIEYLDHETAKIDSLIAKQEKLIELLKEKRQAVISHAVTKGLNSNVPMKDSGVEWLGQVPEHWIVSKLKYESEVVDCRNKTPEYFENGEYFVIRTTNVKNQKLNFNGALYTDKKNFEIWTQRGVPPAGSILFTREAPTGEVCLVPENIKFCMGQRMMNFIANTKSYSDYLFDYLISDCLEHYINSVSHGSTVTHLRVEQVENIPVLVPSDAEIKEIHHHILIIKNKYDAIENKAHQTIQLMQERRTALISAAVTGKIDVQNWQNPTEAKMEFSA